MQTITQNQDTLNMVLTFGKYNGKSVKDVVLVDRNYISWLAANSFTTDVANAAKLALSTIAVTDCIVKEPVKAKENENPYMVVIPFGKHNGKTIGAIASEELSYVKWLSEKSTDAVIKEAADKVYHEVKKQVNATRKLERDAAKKEAVAKEQMYFDSLLSQAMDVAITRLMAGNVYVAEYRAEAGRINNLYKVLELTITDGVKYNDRVPVAKMLVERVNLVTNEVELANEVIYFDSITLKYFSRDYLLVDSIKELEGAFFIKPTTKDNGVVIDLATNREVAQVTWLYEIDYLAFDAANYDRYVYKGVKFVLENGKMVDKFPGKIEGYKEGGIWKV